MVKQRLGQGEATQPRADDGDLQSLGSFGSGSHKIEASRWPLKRFGPMDTADLSSSQLEPKWLRTQSKPRTVNPGKHDSAREGLSLEISREDVPLAG
mmetsp:Transcript_75594/g.180608  ORF Transcript_75594/g.180608 Transcript_75594/m.180608 type:complete len:97 (+) Transcript_75594:1454-1744(+)